MPLLEILRWKLLQQTQLVLLAIGTVQGDGAPDSGDQFLGRYRLDEVDIRSREQPGQLLFLPSHCGEHDKRSVGGRSISAQRSNQLIAIQCRHLHIDYYAVRVYFEVAFEPLDTVGGAFYRKGPQSLERQL